MIYYLIIINILTFIIYGIDKEKSKKNKYRISEKTLITLAIIRGPLGALLGMNIFHHKTKKTKFIILIPLIMIIWTYIIYKLRKYIM